MADSQYDQFLDESTSHDADADHPLGRSCLFGLYLSWCSLHGSQPRTEKSFWSAMNDRNIRAERTKLRMKGPASVDYILTSQPALA